MNKYESGKSHLGVAVVGARGYTGLELVRLLQKHPAVQVKACFSTSAGFTLSDYLPGRGAANIHVLTIDKLDSLTPELNTVFLATPPEISLEWAPSLLKRGINVIDLSGAFRLKGGSEEVQQSQYQEFYGFRHPNLPLLKYARYGLIPWNTPPTLPNVPTLNRQPTLVANPGCYATSVLMALLPLLKQDLIESENIVIDAKSGTSGAGRRSSEALLFTEVEGECRPYKVGRHQHFPEIKFYLEEYSGRAVDFAFTTHLLPVRRGILSSIYAVLKRGITGNDIGKALQLAYKDYGLLEWSELDGSSKDAYALSMKRVVGTGVTRIVFHTVGSRLYLFSIIDNLVKGAAGQAIENFNLIHQMPVTLGLEFLEGVL